MKNFNLRIVFAAFGFIVLLLVAPANSALASLIVNIQPVQVCLDDGTGCAQMGFFEAETDKIWAQAGIDISFGATFQLNATNRLEIDLGSDEHIDLYNDGEALAGFGDPYADLFIPMYFVDDMPGYYGLGCGAAVYSGYCGGMAGVIIADEIFSFNSGVGRLDTIAHEIGHVLGLTHEDFGAGVSDNLMTTGGSRSVPESLSDINPDGLQLSKLTDEQITEALNSDFVVAAVPEPSTIFLLSSGLFGLGFFGRRIKK